MIVRNNHESDNSLPDYRPSILETMLGELGAQRVRARAFQQRKRERLELARLVRQDGLDGLHNRIMPFGRLVKDTIDRLMILQQVDEGDGTIELTFLSFGGG
jgi:hypothetical protein